MYYKFFFNSVLLVPNYTKFSFFTSIHSVCRNSDKGSELNRAIPQRPKTYTNPPGLSGIVSQNLKRGLCPVLDH